MSKWEEWNPSGEKKEVEWKDKTWKTPFGVISFRMGALDNMSGDFYKQKLLTAAKNGEDSEIQRLLQSHKLDVNSRHYLGWTALHVAAWHGHTSTVKLLIKSGADPNLADEFSTCSEIAETKVVEKGSKHILKARLAIEMMREDAFPDKLARHSHFKGYTALHYAVISANIATVEILINMGANPLAKTAHKGYLPKHFAKEESMKDLFKVQSEELCEKNENKNVEEPCCFPQEARLKDAIVGQADAITTVASAIRRKETGWGDDEHPLVFLFLGSSGVGKTELAKQIGKYLHKDNTEAFIRIDMTEYLAKENVARLIGSPPGYIGHNEGGQLTEKLQKFPNAVVLFDEVEKAHLDVLNVLLPLFDEGRITDGRGKTIVCKEAIFVMTSNLASEEIAKYVLQFRGEVYNGNNEEKIVISSEFKDKEVWPILKRHFKRDEFLGRISEIVYFLPFSRSEVRELITVELKSWAEKAKKKHKIDLKWDDRAVEALSDGHYVRFGARSIKDNVGRRICNELAAAQQNGQLPPNSKAKITAKVDPQSGEVYIKLKITSSTHDD